MADQKASRTKKRLAAIRNAKISFNAPFRQYLRLRCPPLSVTIDNDADYD